MLQNPHHYPNTVMLRHPWEQGAGGSIDGRVSGWTGGTHERKGQAAAPYRPIMGAATHRAW